MIPEVSRLASAGLGGRGQRGDHIGSQAASHWVQVKALPTMPSTGEWLSLARSY